MKSNGQVDFSNPDAVQCVLEACFYNLIPDLLCSDNPRELTRSLLKRDFELQIKLSKDRLCPPVCFIIFKHFLKESTDS